MDCPDFVPVDPIEPGEMVDVSVTLRAPDTLGNFAGAWRMMHSEGGYFSPEIWVVIQTVY